MGRVRLATQAAGPHLSPRGGRLLARGEAAAPGQRGRHLVHHGDGAGGPRLSSLTRLPEGTVSTARGDVTGTAGPTQRLPTAQLSSGKEKLPDRFILG